MLERDSTKEEEYQFEDFNLRDIEA